MQGNVQSIDALRELRGATLTLAKSFGDLSFDLTTEVTRSMEWIHEIAPQYWRHQLQLAERRLSEALDNLASMQATVGGRDKPAATEAKKRVRMLKQRVTLCHERFQEIKKWSAEFERASNLMVTTCANLQQQSETELPKAAAKLATWIRALDVYAESSVSTTEPPITDATSNAGDLS
jgi:hypothetical protein